MNFYSKPADRECRRKQSTNSRKTASNLKEDLEMARIFNFSAGPAMMPLPVLEEIAKEVVDYRGCGMSVMEMHTLEVHMEI